MKCLLFWFMTLFLLLSNVAALSLIIQSQTIVGAPSLVLWSRQSTDSADLGFDLRFVQNEFTDVGLAAANIHPEADEEFGTVTVVFPGPGKYVVKAVSGSPRNIQIGTSNEVVAVQIVSSTTATSSTNMPSTSTVSTTPSSTPTPTPPPSGSPPPPQPGSSIPISGLKRRVNLPALVGGIIGGLLLLVLIAVLFVFVSRRRKDIARRFTFHRDMMVQRRLSIAASLPAPATGPATIITPYPFAGPDLEAQRRPSMASRPSTLASRPRPTDLEQAVSPPTPISALPSAIRPLGSAPLGTGHIVPSPRGPRPSIRRVEQTTVTTSASPTAEPAQPRTQRQQEIVDRIKQLRTQMTELQRVSRPGTTHVTVLDDMQRQMVWLREQEHGLWALGQTDVLPPGHARFMTP